MLANNINIHRAGGSCHAPWLPGFDRSLRMVRAGKFPRLHGVVPHFDKHFTCLVQKYERSHERKGPSTNVSTLNTQKCCTKSPRRIIYLFIYLFIWIRPQRSIEHKQQIHKDNINKTEKKIGWRIVPAWRRWNGVVNICADVAKRVLTTLLEGPVIVN